MSASYDIITPLINQIDVQVISSINQIAASGDIIIHQPINAKVTWSLLFLIWHYTCINLINIQTKVFIEIMFLLKQHQISHDKMQKLFKNTPSNHGIFFKNSAHQSDIFENIPLATIILLKNRPSNQSIIQNLPLKTLVLFKNCPQPPWLYSKMPLAKMALYKISSSNYNIIQR